MGFFFTPQVDHSRMSVHGACDPVKLPPAKPEAHFGFKLPRDRYRALARYPTLRYRASVDPVLYFPPLLSGINTKHAITVPLLHAAHDSGNPHSIRLPFGRARRIGATALQRSDLTESPALAGYYPIGLTLVSTSSPAFLHVGLVSRSLKPPLLVH